MHRWTYALALAPLLLAIAAAAQTPTNQLRNVKSGQCLTQKLKFMPCDGSPGQVWSYEAQTGTPVVPPSSSFVPNGYHEVWGDEFGEANLDQSKWWTRMSFADGTLDYLNDEWQRYRESGNHIMTGSTLKLVALPHNGQFWPSGMIRSKVTLPLSSGTGFYVEGRFRILNNRGVWPAFWIAADQRADGGDTWPPEYDIMEVPVNNTSAGGADSAWTPHMGMQTNGNTAYGDTWTYKADGWSDWGFWNAGIDLSKDWHVWGWQYKNRVFHTWIDGKEILGGNYNWGFPDRTPASGNIIVNLAIGGGWAGSNGVDESKFPQALEVDYVRVYEEGTSNTLGVSTVGVDYPVSQQPPGKQVGKKK